MTIELIGPGGAGKTTTGSMISSRLGIRFVDLDRLFASQHGDIGDFIDRHGYDQYARQNVEVYRSFRDTVTSAAVLALSSGFMTYASDIHPEYAVVREAIIRSPTAFVLLPSLDLEVCVSETVRRQSRRPFARPPAREEAVIRERFPIYVRLPPRKIETMRSPDAIAEEVVVALQRQSQPSHTPGCGPHLLPYHRCTN